MAGGERQVARAKRAGRGLLSWKGEWRVAGGEWQVASGEWRVASGEWRVASGRWQVASGEWRVASGEWQVASGEWRGQECRARSIVFPLPHATSPLPLSGGWLRRPAAGRDRRVSRRVFIFPSPLATCWTICRRWMKSRGPSTRTRAIVATIMTIPRTHPTNAPIPSAGWLKSAFFPLRGRASAVDNPCHHA